MRAKTVTAIKNAKEIYEGRLAGLEGMDYISQADRIWKEIRMDLNIAAGEEITKYGIGLGKKDDRSRADEKGVRITEDECDFNIGEATVGARMKYIGIYDILKKHLEERTWKDKLFHPIRTHRENKSFKELKETMGLMGITDAAVEEYHKGVEKYYSNIDIDEALDDERINKIIDIEEPKAEPVKFEKPEISFQEKMDQLYLL